MATDNPNYDRIVKNPHYKPSSEQLDEIENKRATEYYQRKKDENVRHSVTVKKHDPFMQKEDDNERPQNPRRANRGTVPVRKDR